MQLSTRFLVAAYVTIFLPLGGMAHGAGPKSSWCHQVRPVAAVNDIQPSMDSSGLTRVTREEIDDKAADVHGGPKISALACHGAGPMDTWCQNSRPLAPLWEIHMSGSSSGSSTTFASASLGKTDHARNSERLMAASSSIWHVSFFFELFRLMGILGREKGKKTLTSSTADTSGPEEHISVLAMGSSNQPVMAEISSAWARSKRDRRCRFP